MNIIFFSICIAIVIVNLYLIFALITENQFYSSALVTLFIYDKKKWKLYLKAKKEKVKIYKYPLDYEIDADMGDVPEFYLYPIQKDDGIHYYLYTDNYKFITDNFQLISRL
ncbi:MAG: hypothetical protein MSC51_03755 [Mollicutes bacterium]|nr:hypothetical protein [Mollicutes bacterium]